VSYDFAFRQFRQGDVDGSVQMFFDLTAMQTLYGQGGLLVQSPLNGLPLDPAWRPVAARSWRPRRPSSPSLSTRRRSK
jgi:hypothetical protein